MNANELRIGNLIFDKNTEVEIIGILRGGFYLENSDLQLKLNVCGRFSPIPLTEELLVKFGFEHEDCIYKKNNCPILFDDDWNCFIERTFENELFVNIKYVHQLQNLYFALTGEELTTN